MSFKLSKQKKLNNKDPIAYTTGTSKKDRLYLYINDFDYRLNDCPADVLNTISIKQKNELDKSLKDGLEPEDEELTKIYYSCIEFIKKKNSKIILRDKKMKFEYLPSTRFIERVLVSGISGSGKSTWSSKYIKNYLKQHKDNPFYVLSNVHEDEVIDKLEPTRLDAYEIATEGMTVDEVTNSIMLIDDVDTIENAAIRKAIRSFVNNMLEVSRHYKTNLIITSHHIQNYQQTRTQLNESNIVVLFMKSNARAIKNYLKTYENFNNDQINRFLNLNSRWGMIYKGFGHPPYVLYEKGAYIL
jgi:adenylate kinase family enzyme